MIKDPERARMYRVFRAMHFRCSNPKDRHYRHYGGRGIRVCERWLNFRDFVLDMGPRPSSHHSVDRINNDGNYDPGNCRWATRSEQTRNTRRNRRLANGLVLEDACMESGMATETVRHRLNSGWSEEDALSTPPYERQSAGSLARMCASAGMPYGSVWMRLKRGWTIERALSSPIKGVAQ